MLIMIFITMVLLMIYLLIILNIKKETKNTQKILKLQKEKRAIIQKINRILDSKLTFVKWAQESGIFVPNLDLSAFDKEEAVAEMQLMLKEEEIKQVQK